jgi:hypothetical protein
MHREHKCVVWPRERQEVVDPRRLRLGEELVDAGDGQPPRPVWAPMDLDRDRQARPADGPGVLKHGERIGAPLALARHPRRIRQLLEPRGEESTLNLRDVPDEDVQVTERATDGIGVERGGFGPFDQKDRAVVRTANVREHLRRCERDQRRSALRRREFLRSGRPAFPREACCEQVQAMGVEGFRAAAGTVDETSDSGPDPILEARQHLERVFALHELAALAPARSKDSASQPATVSTTAV